MIDTKQQLARSKGQMTPTLAAELTGRSLAELALIRQTVAKDAPLVELVMFIRALDAMKLDANLRQAYWIRRKNRKTGEVTGTLQTGIDGLRSIAERSGAYAGSEPPEFRNQIEWMYRNRRIIVPERARVVVWKIVQGHKAAFTGEAWWDEFVPSEGQADMWARMPRHMLAKCAEAQALRKAFASLLSGISIEELDQERGDLEIVNPPERLPEPGPRYTAADYSEMTADFFGDEPDPQPEPPASQTDQTDQTDQAEE